MKKGILYFILILFGLTFLYPFLWMLSSSLKPEVEIGSVGLTSPDFSLNSYRKIFHAIPIERSLFNSFFVSTSTTLLVIFFCSIIGYALSRLDFKGKNIIFSFILMTMIIPFHITMIPMYILMVKFGWIDSFLALIIPGAISPLGILLFRQFFLGIPQELIDAARIDGCNEFRILFKIVYPLSKPVIITVGILTFMAVWNDVLWPLIVIRERDLMTMPQMVTLFVTGGQGQQLGEKLAAATVLAVPIVIVYAFFQRYFIETMASSGLKN